MEEFEKDVLVKVIIEKKVLTAASQILNFKEWVQLGRYLEIADEDLDNIEEQTKTKSFNEKMHRMLTLWRTKRPKESNLYVLLQALEKMEYKLYIEKILKEFVTSGYLQDNVVLPPTASTVKEIKYDCYSILGRGPLGTTIFKGLFGKTEAAIKQFDRVSSTLPHSSFETLSGPKAGHINLLRCYGTEQDSKHVYMALQPCQGNLASYLSKIKSDKVFFGEKLSPIDMLKQITNGVNFLHEYGIVHENIKPENILLSEKDKSNKMTVLISDFGVRNKTLGENPNGKISQNPGYTAYEVLQGDKYTFASDIFSLGCIYYYVVTDGKTLFNDDQDVVNRVPELKELTNKVQSYFRKYIGGMINQNPAKRPTCKQLLDSALSFAALVQQFSGINMHLVGFVYALTGFPD